MTESNNGERLHQQDMKEVLFPAYEAHESIPQRLIELVKFSNEIGVPFPAESNRKYAGWWRSLHEIGHWAVKPQWYTDTDLGGQDIPVLQAAVALPGSGLEIVNYYKAGNDIIPDADMMDDLDPTPHEREVQPWTIRLMLLKGYQHPFSEILEQGQSYADVHKLGDAGWHKPASMRIWAPTKQFNPEAVRTMVYFDMDPIREKFRAQGPGFDVPFPNPKSFEEVKANRHQISLAYPDKASLHLPELTERDQEVSQLYHDTYLEWESQTKDGTFDPELQARLKEQFDLVERYSFYRFEEMADEIRKKS